MSPIDYTALSGQGSGGDPPDGLHNASLMRAALVETSKGTSLVTEWQTWSEPRYYWTTWFGFEGQRLSFTQDFLDAAGIDRSQVTNDTAFSAALSEIQGRAYQVRTQAGASWVNTYVESPDVPIDSAGLPQPQAPSRQQTPPPPPSLAQMVQGASPYAPAQGTLVGPGMDDDIPF